MSTTALTTDKESFDQMLRRLSEASVDHHFDAFADIKWNDPAYAVVPDDDRWILPTGFPLGRHPWYLGLSRERKIEVGMAYQAQMCKVGLQFESILMRGVLQWVGRLENNDPQYRYLMHEVTEECHHTQMFQEMVNRIDVGSKGAPRWFRFLDPIVPLAGNLLPELFFTGILAGEEPIDHIQKAVLRSGVEMHPLMVRIMQIHVAEEARHISFAHEWLRQNVPNLPRWRRRLLMFTYPATMRILGDVIAKPTAEFCEQLDIPKAVVDEVYWDSEEGRKMLRDLFADVRTLAEECGLITPVSRRFWKMFGIDGRPARYRSEPAPMAA